MKNIIIAARETYELRRATRQEWRTLQRELADYTTVRDRLDLEAVLDRYPDEDTADIRRMLNTQPA